MLNGIDLYDVESLRELEIERLERLLEAVWPQACEGSKDERKFAADIIKQQSDLLCVAAGKSKSTPRKSTQDTEFDLSKVSVEDLEQMRAIVAKYRV